MVVKKEGKKGGKKAAKTVVKRSAKGPSVMTGTTAKKSSKGTITKRPAAGKIHEAVLAPEGVGTAKPVEAAGTRAAEQKTCRACEMSDARMCPLCTNEGLVLMGAAIVLIALNYTWSRYAAWAALILAFLVPVIKRRSQK